MGEQIRIVPLAFFFDDEYFDRAAAESWLSEKHGRLPPHDYSAPNRDLASPHVHAFVFAAPPPESDIKTLPPMFVKLEQGITLAFAEPAPPAIIDL